MNTAVAWPVSDRRRYGMRTLICILGSILFLIFISTAVSAKQTFGPPAYEDTYDCTKVQWLQKDHKYVGFPFKSEHQYFFRGKWLQPACDPEGKSCFTQHWDVEVKGLYNEETDVFNESVTITGNIGTHGGGSINIYRMFLVDGKISLDPWIFPTHALSEITSRCTIDRWTSPQGSADYPRVYREDPPIFFSRCAFTAEERGALGKEKPVPMTCTDSQIKAKPTVLFPTPNQNFNDYKDAYAEVKMPCLPPKPESSQNGFNYMLEEKIVENDGSEYWLPFCTHCGIEMVPSQYNYVSRGLKKLNLEQAGDYRIKFNHQVRTEATVLAGDYTDWIYFSARPLISSNLDRTKTQKVSAGALQSTTAPAVIVNNIRLNPQRPKAGQVFEVWIDFFNKGKGPTKATQKYYATCKPQNGGPPVWNPGPHPLEPIIPPNQSVQVVFKGSIKDPGNYVLAIKPDPMASDVTFAKMITFTVDPPLSPQLKVKPKPGVMQKH